MSDEVQRYLEIVKEYKDICDGVWGIQNAQIVIENMPVKHTALEAELQKAYVILEKHQKDFEALYKKELENYDDCPSEEARAVKRLGLEVNALKKELAQWKGKQK